MTIHFSLEKTSQAKSAYNKKSQKAYDWLNTVPWGVFGIDASDGIDFQEILNLQIAVGVDADGLVGLGTLRATQSMLKSRHEQLWNPITGQLHDIDPLSQLNHVLWKGLEVPLLTVDSCPIYTYKHSEGLNLHDTGSFTKKSRKINSAIVHWGGLNPQHLARVFSNRKASSHFAVGISEDSGEIAIYQYLDVAHVAWHAKGANENSIGIDICQQPEVKHLGYYSNRGYDVKTISNPSAPTYGPSKIVSLEPRILKATAELLRGLYQAFEIPHYIPSMEAGKLQEGEHINGGIFSHFHVDFKGQGKWDVAPWWDSIIEEFHQSKSIM